MKKIAIYALTKKGADLARFVARQIGSVIRETAEAKDVPRVELFFTKGVGMQSKRLFFLRIYRQLWPDTLQLMMVLFSLLPAV